MRRAIALLALVTLPALAAADIPPPVIKDSSATRAEVPPPPTVSAQSGAQAEPEVRIIERKDAKIEEYRLNGKLYMVKVTPSVGLPYYLIDDDGSGQLKPASSQQRLITPRWVLLRF
ncbi:DUF2782 domain-containing protein [Paludibacterium yongneupense]|uniref:DUF2782 domain-containing protein n=1 Tax=Paludibacterium yongneupense TaxID=400061 RepID=UPI00040B2AA9|nr:DUF2782 domain-containing protein [Paludibacterium yongneupense]